MKTRLVSTELILVVILKIHNIKLFKMLNEYQFYSEREKERERELVQQVLNLNPTNCYKSHNCQ